MGRRICIVDGTPSDITKSNFWFQAGARLFRGSYDDVYEVRSVEAFYDKLRMYKPGDVTELQVYGHGSPGASFIGREKLDPASLAWEHIAGAAVWFRQCKVAQGEKGHMFAQLLGDRGLSFVGHLSNIGALGHSYLVGCKRGAKPWWPVDLKPDHASPFHPRTVPAFTMQLPTWTFKSRM